MRKPLRMAYDCLKCPAWCCSYPNIFVTANDLARLARHFNISEGEAAKRFTKHSAHYNRAIMRHKPDSLFGSACRFLDSKTRRCTVYEARPHGCRTYPGGRCGYWDFLKEERARQEDAEYIVTTDHRT